MNDELIYQLALTLVPNIGDVQAKLLIRHFGSASAVFKAKKKELEKIEGLYAPAARSLKEFADFSTAEKEASFLEKYRIQSLFITDADYPQRLLNCADSPTLLFFKGSADLNKSRIISIVGSRQFTAAGKQFAESLIAGLAAHEVLIVSGLAYGIDAIAHKSALKNGIPTVGVVGHGLDTIYPPENAGLAKEMIQEQGGILSEFFSGTPPDRHHFPLRNRIVAGMSDATIVIETRVEGGSMITAKLADSYNRDVFAVPGRPMDKSSAGCNHLIKHNRAIMLTDVNDLMEAMGWKEKDKTKKPQTELFIELSEDEKKVVALLANKESVHIDEINLHCNLSTSAIAAALLNLELQNVVVALPGKMYRLA